MSIQFTAFVLCYIILPNLFVVTCLSHCDQGKCQIGGNLYAETCCLKHKSNLLDCLSKHPFLFCLLLCCTLVQAYAR